MYIGAIFWPDIYNVYVSFFFLRTKPVYFDLIQTMFVLAFLLRTTFPYFDLMCLLNTLAFLLIMLPVIYINHLRLRTKHYKHCLECLFVLILNPPYETWVSILFIPRKALTFSSSSTFDNISCLSTSYFSSKWVIFTLNLIITI